MSEKEKKEKKGGFFRLIFWILVIYLLANFCWNGKPLYQLIWSEESVKKAAETVEKAKVEMLDTVEETKNKIVDEKTAVIPEEDKESLKNLIEEKAQSDK